MQFTACYTKLEEGFGYMGRLLEWPNVITSGKDIEECEFMLKDAANEMMLAHKDDNRKIVLRTIITKPISIDIDEGMTVKMEEEEALLANVD